MPVATVRILMVEDDRDDALLVADLLTSAKRAQFLLDSVETGEAAEEKIKRDRYDVILLDYRLPDTTGLKFMQWLVDNHYRIPVVLVTSHGDTRLQAKALEAGFCEYLEKGTFNADVLERTLMYAIGLHDRQQHTPDQMGVGLLIQELVGLTRESVTAQTRTASGISELRNDLKEDVTGLRGDIRELKAHAHNHRTEIFNQRKKGLSARVKDVFNWIVVHPVASIIIVLMFALLLVLAVLLINTLDAEKIKQLKTTELLDLDYGPAISHSAG